jgi:hypothetical protein
VVSLDGRDTVRGQRDGQRNIHTQIRTPRPTGQERTFR